MENNRLKKIIIGSIVFVFAVACVLFAYFYIIPIIKQKQMSKLKTDAYELYRKGDPKASSELEKALNSEKEPNAKAFVAASFSLDKIRSDNPEDQRRAVEMTKAAIADKGITAGTKAGMINLLVDLGIVEQDQEFMKEVFFGDDPYKAFFRGENEQTLAALIRLEEWSVEIFPTAQAHLRLAEFYSSLAMNAADAKKADYITRTKFNLRHGEALIDRDGRYNTPERQAGLYTFRASSYGALALLGEGELGRSEEMFKDAISQAENHGDSIYFRSFALNARLRYALTLFGVKDANRNSDIQEILKPFGELKLEDADKIGYIHVLAGVFRDANSPGSISYQKGYPALGDYEKLAEVSAEFKTFLDTFGFKAS